MDRTAARPSGPPKSAKSQPRKSRRAPAAIDGRRTILIATWGTRGDVQPLIAVALALRGEGYDVRIAAPPNFRQWIESFDIAFFGLGRDLHAVLADPAVARGLTLSRWSQLFHGGLVTDLVVRPSMSDLPPASQGVDAVLFSTLVYTACDIAEARRIPAAAIALQPLTETSAFPSLAFPFPTLGPFFNRLTWGVHSLARLTVRRELAHWRENELGLPARPGQWRSYQVDGRPVPRIHGFSRHLVPPPADWPAEDSVTGFWFLDDVVENDAPAEGRDDLVSFLRDGPPPVYVGFGSMPFPNPDENLEMLKNTLKRLGQRALISKGWAGLSGEAILDASGMFFPLDSVPHEWLFPQVAAVIHHGGSGTVAMGLRAGRPTLVSPVILDQWFWGYRIADAGAGPKPMHAREWTPSRLERALTRLLHDRGIGDRAAALGAAIRGEDGIRQAVERIRRVVGEPSGRRRP